MSSSFQWSNKERLRAIEPLEEPKPQDERDKEQRRDEEHATFLLLRKKNDVVSLPLIHVHPTLVPFAFGHPHE